MIRFRGVLLAEIAGKQCCGLPASPQVACDVLLPHHWRCLDPLTEMVVPARLLHCKATICPFVMSKDFVGR